MLNSQSKSKWVEISSNDGIQEMALMEVFWSLGCKPLEGNSQQEIDYKVPAGSAPPCISPVMVTCDPFHPRSVTAIHLLVTHVAASPWTLHSKIISKTNLLSS